MVEWMLANVICREFETRVGKVSQETGKAMHVGFQLSCKDEDQYNVTHMYIFAPCNYVYVAIQTERITEEGDRVVGEMRILSYHDSCWRDAIQQWIYQKRGELHGFSALGKLFDWYDILTLTSEEMEYLSTLENDRRNQREPAGKNPFDLRGIWAKKV